MQIVPLSWIVFLSTSAFWAALANAQNTTIEPSSTQSIQYLPADAWSFSSRPGASSNGSFAHTVAENATVIFNISVPATAFFWRGFLPTTAARYSICIDCTSESEIGNVVTLEATPANSSDTPVILFASNSLANTTHTVFLRNVRNSIEGVVGEMSVDALIFTPGIPDASDSIPPNRASTDNKLVIAIAVVSGLIGIIVGSLVLLIRLQACRNRPRTPQFSQKRPLLLTTGAWKRRRRKGDLESAPMIEGVIKAKPPATGVTQSPTANKQNGRIKSVVAFQSNPNSSEADVPYITVTSPTTIPTSASTYSTTHDVPFPPRPMSKFGEAERGVRQSDPYVSYAAAYAAFVGVEDDRSSIRQQTSALRESATLPPPPRILVIDRKEGTSRGSSDHAPPSAFKGKGIRGDMKRKRTLSDKIKRGTLPPPPPLPERTSVTIERKESSEGNNITTAPAAVASTSKPETDTQEPSPDESVDPSRPSFLPEFSSDSAPSTVPTTRDSVPSNNHTDPPSPVAILPNRSSLRTTSSSKDITYWNRQRKLSLDENANKDDGNTVPFPNNQAANTAIRASLDAPLMEEDLSPRNNMRSSTSLIGSEIVIEGGDTSPVVPNFNRVTTISMMTTKTVNTINTTRSSYSFTPSVSEFPMPPFNGMNNNANASEEAEVADDSSLAVNVASSTPNRTRTSSSASASETGSSAKSAQGVPIPPPSYPNRQRKPRGPPVRIAQLGLGLPISSQTPTAPLRRNSSKSSNSFRRSSGGRKASRLSQLPFKGEPLSLPQRRSEDGEVETVGSTLSLATSENGGSKGTVPFYMASESQLNVDGSPEGVPSLNPSRLTIGSTLTTTDEEYASGVQVVVATRGVPPDLPRAIKQSTPSPVPFVTTPASDTITEQSSSDSKWEMVYPKPGPPQGLTPISIVGANRSYRPNGPTANVPVSALTDRFDAGSVESGIPLGQLDVLTSQASNAGTGMPWSPNFLWPITPPFEFTSRPPLTSDSLKPTFSPQRPVISSSPKPREPVVMAPSQPAPTSRSVPEAVEAKNSDAETANSNTSSKPNIKIHTELGWKDVVGVTSPVQTRARSNSKQNYNSRLSTYSTASSFFGGRDTPMGPPPPFPLDTPLPTPPLATATNDPGRQSTYFNMRGWQARSGNLQSPTSPNPYSPRHTGATPLNVNTVFATSGSSVPRPKSALRRTDLPES